ncbi:MAG: hypothetical protein Q4B08_09180 [Propionibacteriaceae bacterium]|nr:hypothetical protein [Propionibacteriaceae bacterium]
MSTDDTWADFFTTRRDQLERRAEALAEVPEGALATVRAAELARELIEEYRGDDWLATKVFVARLGQRRAWLLSRLDEDQLALAELDEIASAAMSGPEPEVVEVGADARVDRARLLWALGRQAEAFTELRSLIEAIADADHPGIRHTHANAQFDAIRWTLSSIDASDGVHGQQRVIDACAELIASHRDRDHGPEAFYVIAALSVQQDALTEQARLLREQGSSEDADALLLRARVLTDDAWAQYRDHRDPQVQARLANLLLASRELGTKREVTEAAEMVLNQWGASDEPELEPELAWAMQCRVRDLRERGKTEHALAELDALARRFGGSEHSRVRNSLLWGITERARILVDQGRGREAIAELQQTVSWLAHDCAFNVRVRIAQALDLAADLLASELEPMAPERDAEQGADVEASEGSAIVQRPLTSRMRAYAEAVDLLVRHFADDEQGEIRELVADALQALAGQQRRCLNLDAAVASYRRFIGIFDEDTHPPIEMILAIVRMNLGYILMALLGRYDEAVQVYDEAMSRHQFATSAQVRDVLAKIASSRHACLNTMNELGLEASYGEQYEDLSISERERLESVLDRAIARENLTDFRGAVMLYDQILVHVESLHPELRRRSLDALVRKGYCLAQLGQYEAALAVNREAVARYGVDLPMDLQKDVALALSNVARNLDRLGRHDEELAAYDDLLCRWPEPSIDYLKEKVASARFAKAVTLAELGRSREAEEVYLECIRQDLPCSQTVIRATGASAGLNLGYLRAQAGRFEAAAEAFHQVVEWCPADSDLELRQHRMKAQLALARIHASRGQHTAATAAYRDVLAFDRDVLSDALRGTVRDELFKLSPGRGLVSLLDTLKRWFSQPGA